MSLGFSLCVLILFSNRISIGQESSQLSSKRLENISTSLSAERAGEERGILGGSRMGAEGG
jgi:hypothetical protein